MHNWKVKKIALESKFFFATIYVTLVEHGWSIISIISIQINKNNYHHKSSQPTYF